MASIVNLFRGPIPPPLGPEAPVGARVLRAAVRLVHGLNEHRAAEVAPAMAFHFFLSLIPVLVLVGFVLGQVVRQRGVDALLGPALDRAPGQAEQIVREQLERMAGTGGSSASLGVFGAFGFLWVAATGTHGLMDAFERAAGAPRRAWWTKRALAMTWVLGFLVALALLAWGVLRVDKAIHAVADERARVVARAAKIRFVRPLLRDAWERYAAVGLLTVLGIGGLAAFFRFAVAHPPGVKRRALPGATIAFVAWLAISWGFGEYTASLGKYALYYGSVAAVAVLLVWFYLTSWSLLIGAELNAQLEGLRDTKEPASSE